MRLGSRLSTFQLYGTIRGLGFLSQDCQRGGSSRQDSQDSSDTRRDSLGKGTLRVQYSAGFSGGALGYSARDVYILSPPCHQY